MRTIVLSLPSSGLVKADLGLRYYLDGELDSSGVVDGLVLTALGGLEYALSGIPEVGTGSWATITLSYGGLSWSYVYPQPQSTAPPSVVIPIRDTGLVAADFDLELFKDGASLAASLTTEEAVAAGGDYITAGWGDDAGDYVLLWRYNGITYSFAWTVVAVAEMCDLIAGLEDLFSDTIVAQPGTMDEFGDWVASGSASNLTCHIEGQSRLVRDASGREVTSSLVVYLAGYYDLTVDLHRFTLPSRFAPRTDLQAVRIDKYSDEVGTCYEVLNFP